MAADHPAQTTLRGHIRDHAGGITALLVTVTVVVFIPTALNFAAVMFVLSLTGHIK